MKLRTIIGIVFIVASLTKLATIWGIIEWNWFARVSEEPWVTYFTICLLIYVGVSLIIDSYRRDPDQWLQRPLPIGEDGKRICCSVHYGGDEYVYRGEPFHGARLDAFCGGIRMDLRNAVITEDEEIEIHTFCGGVELFVPQTVNVEVKSRSFLGGVGNHASRITDKDAHCLHIIADNFLGGVDIKRALVMLTMIFALGMNAVAQPKQVIEFQTAMSIHETTYKNFVKDGKYKEAIAPLVTLIQMIDTTNIYKVLNINEATVRQLNAPYYYDLACCYAVTKQKKQALKALEQAVNLGYNDYNNMLYDKDLTLLRKDKTYQTLLAAVREKTPLNVLKKSAPYAQDSVKLESKFTYQTKDDYRLAQVRDYLKLDSVAGQGDELSKIINLLHFVHDEMPHDGNHRAFAEMDAIDLYNYCKTTGRGVNCRQLAISLCEVYLSMGIPARYVTCMAADPNDGECHVINSVWSDQLQKWLWIDPTNDAWVTDENGTMLSIAEVRERMINDQPLVLCETANWNHREKQTKEGYLDGYMSKNLYYFVCKKYSRFNPESDYRPNPTEEDIRLIPVGFVNDNWKCETTTDPDFFWAKPEM